MNKFLIQSDDYETIGDYAVDLLSYEIAINEADKPFRKMSLKKLSETKEDLAEYIPVGTLDFTETFMKKYLGIKNIKPQLIPDAIRCYARRNFAIVQNTSGIEECMDKWGKDKVFVKEGECCKGIRADVYSREALPRRLANTKYFVSEVTDFQSEWRVFVLNGCIQGISCYLGDEWLLPDKNVVKGMINSMNDIEATNPILDSYTLDVGVDDTGHTVPIEVHNFISCGLYGFYSPRLPLMLTRAFHDEVRIHMSQNAESKT